MFASYAVSDSREKSETGAYLIRKVGRDNFQNGKRSQQQKQKNKKRGGGATTSSFYRRK